VTFAQNAAVAFSFWRLAVVFIDRVIALNRPEV
jgi:hypothetical protein